MQIKYFFVALIFVTFLISPAASQAKEVINSYHSKILVSSNGDLHITETIQVTAEGHDIKRGIYRDFPLFRRTFFGGLLPTNITLHSVTKDGRDEPYHTENLEGDMRLYIGHHSVFLAKGEMPTYEIVFSVPAQVFFYDDYDELYWNVIGTQWTLPILKASAEIYMPNSAPIMQYSVYTGKALKKGDNFESWDNNGKLNVKTHRPLDPYEGMTVAVSISKGHVNQPAWMSGISFFWIQHPGLRVMIIGLLGMAAYYYWAWDVVGRDPKGRALTPFYDPPKNISPAMAAYIQSMGDSDTKKNMTSAIVSLAAKGFFEIRELGKNRYKITRTEKSEEDGNISEDEQVIYDRITSNLIIRPSSEDLVKTAEMHKEILEEICNKRFFHVNTNWWMGGLIPLISSIFILSLDPQVHAETLGGGLIFALVFGGVSIGVFIHGVLLVIKGTFQEKFTGAFLCLWSIGFSIGGGLGIVLMASAMSWLVIAIILIMPAIFIFMRHIMKAPTRRGREIMDKIDGLQYYMEEVEEKVLKKFDPPEMSRELYEKYLPYAVALGVESKWGDKFASTAAGAAVAQSKTSSYSPSWYSGSSSSGFTGRGFSTASMISSIGSSISASSSSNSSSGGGSSGGGGGGGGGGGW